MFERQILTLLYIIPYKNNSLFLYRNKFYFVKFGFYGIFNLFYSVVDFLFYFFKLFFVFSFSSITSISLLFIKSAISSRGISNALK